METVYHNHRDGSEIGVFKSFDRELGLTHSSRFSRSISSSETLVKRIDLCGKLNGHEGCVNTVEFNSTGDHLVSGSDDRQVMFWNWAAKKVVFSYPSGHHDNIFQARIMPFTDDRTIVTSSADGQVRLGLVFENGHVETKRLGKHQGRIHKLAVEPGSPHILYSCGEDGFVQHFDLRSNSSTKIFSCSSFAENAHRQSSSSIRLNAIVIDPRNPNYFAIGGSDIYARVYDIRKIRSEPSSDSDKPFNTFCPKHLIKNRDVHITGLAYSNTSELLVSYNDELIYLFQKNMGLSPAPLAVPPEVLENLDNPQVYTGHRNSLTVKGVSFFGPNDSYVMNGSDCGHIFIWKKKEARLVRVITGDKRIVNHVEPHPSLPVLASCGLEKNIKMWGPTSNDINPLPHDLEDILESNRLSREDHSGISLTPDVIMHFLRLHRRQALAYIERRPNRDEVETSDDEDGRHGLVLGFSDGEVSLDDVGNDAGDPTDCNIS